MSTPKPNGPPNTPPPPSVNHSDASIRGPFVLDPTSPAATTKDPTSQAQGQSSTTAEAQDNVVHLRRSPGAPNFLKTEDLNDMESASAEPTHIGSPQSERDVKRRKTRRGSGVRAKEKKAYEAYLRQGDRSLHTSGALPNAPAPTASEAGQPSLLQHRMFNFKRAPPTTGASATSAFSAFPTASSGGAGAFVAGSGTTSAFAPRSGVSAFAGFGRPSTTPLSVDSGTEAAPAFVPTRGVSAFAGFGRPPTAQPAPDLATVTASPSALSSDSGGFAGFGPRPAAQPLLDSDSGTGSTCTFPLSSGFSGFAGYGRPSAAPPGTAVGQTGRQVGDSGGVENGPVGVDAAEATTECDVELEEMAKKPIRQLQAKVKVLRSVNEKAMKERDVLRAELNTFKTLWNKVSPHYPLERALTDATTSKGRTLRKNMTPAKADDPEPTDCADESCRCIESRRDRALVPGWPANGWPSPRLVGTATAAT